MGAGQQLNERGIAHPPHGEFDDVAPSPARSHIVMVRSAGPRRCVPFPRFAVEDRSVRLRWPENPKVVEEGDPLDLSLVLENDGAEPAEFSDAFLVLFGRLLDEGGHEIATAGFRLLRALPLIRYRFDPGHTEAVSVALTLSPDDQRRLPPGRYTVVIPLGDARDEHTNSVLASSGASAPPPLTIEVRAH